MHTPETPSATPVRATARRKRALLAGGALALAVGTAAVVSALPAQAARGGFTNGVCYSQPSPTKTSTVQAQRFLKTEPITLTVKASVDASCNLTYTVTAPSKQPVGNVKVREVKSWAVVYSDSYPGGLSGQPVQNGLNASALTATDTVSIAPLIGLAADDKAGVRIFVEYEGTATEGAEYSTYFVDVPVY